MSTLVCVLLGLLGFYILVSVFVLALCRVAGRSDQAMEQWRADEQQNTDRGLRDLQAYANAASSI